MIYPPANESGWLDTKALCIKMGIALGLQFLFACLRPILKTWHIVKMLHIIHTKALTSSRTRRGNCPFLHTLKSTKKSKSLRVFKNVNMLDLCMRRRNLSERGVGSHLQSSLILILTVCIFVLY